MAQGLDVFGGSVYPGHEIAVDYPTKNDNTSNSNASGNNADAVITLNANQLLDANGGSANGRRWQIGSIFYSYAGSGTLAGGRLLVQDTTNGDTILDIDVTTSAKDFIFYTPALRCKSNATITITLKAGGTNVTGKVNVHAWFLV